MKRTAGLHLRGILLIFKRHIFSSSIEKLERFFIQFKSQRNRYNMENVSSFPFFAIRKCSSHSWSSHFAHFHHFRWFSKYFLFEHRLLRYQINCLLENELPNYSDSCIAVQRNEQSDWPRWNAGSNENVEGDNERHCIDKNAAIIKIV